MKKIALPYLEDILHSIGQIEQYVADDGRSKETFVKNTQAQDAIARRLEIIGKATKRLHEDFKEEYNQIPWKLMSGLRDVLIHEYDQIDLDQVWEVIQKDSYIEETTTKNSTQISLNIFYKLSIPLIKEYIYIFLVYNDHHYG